MALLYRFQWNGYSYLNSIPNEAKILVGREDQIIKELTLLMGDISVHRKGWDALWLLFIGTILVEA
jgi:hypothetical protein